MAKLTDFIAELATSLQMGELAPDEDGAYAIVFDGNLEIEIVPMGQSRFLMRFCLPAVPEDEAEQESLFRACLQRRLTQLHAAPASVTRDADSGRLWLYRLGDAAALDARSGLEFLEEFVNLADQWSQFDPAPKATGFGALPFNMMMRP